MTGIKTRHIHIARIWTAVSSTRKRVQHASADVLGDPVRSAMADAQPPLGDGLATSLGVGRSNAEPAAALVRQSESPKTVCCQSNRPQKIPDLTTQLTKAPPVLYHQRGELPRLDRPPTNISLGDLVALEDLGYTLLSNKGSRRKFVFPGIQEVISLHEPNPQPEVMQYAIRQVVEHLKLHRRI